MAHILHWFPHGIFFHRFQLMILCIIFSNINICWCKATIRNSIFRITSWGTLHSTLVFKKQRNNLEFRGFQEFCLSFEKPCATLGSNVNIWIPRKTNNVGTENIRHEGEILKEEFKSNLDAGKLTWNFASFILFDFLFEIENYFGLCWRFFIELNEKSETVVFACPFRKQAWFYVPAIWCKSCY